jgi:hypothetical protein
VLQRAGAVVLQAGKNTGRQERHKDSSRT